MHDINRRNLLRIACLGPVAVLETRCPNCEVPQRLYPDNRWVDTGLYVDELINGQTRAASRNVGYYVGLEARDGILGVFSFLRRCSHSSCVLPSRTFVDSDVITCGCHGSVFDRYGRIISATTCAGWSPSECQPRANQPSLEHFRVNFSVEGFRLRIFVDTESSVGVAGSAVYLTPVPRRIEDLPTTTESCP